jgi:hypothetical protein
MALGPVDLGVSVLGTGGYVALDKPSPSSFSSGTSRGEIQGFGGLAVGGGLALEARLFGFLGLEIDGIFSRDRGRGEVRIDGREGQVTLGQSAVHVPILLKGVLPLPGLRPFLVAGPELVLPLPAKAEVEPAGSVRAVVGTARYTMLTTGVGAELKLPLPSLDLRASFSLRGSYRLGSSSELSERVTPLGSGALILDGRWRYQGLATAAIGLFF